MHICVCVIKIALSVAYGNIVEKNVIECIYTKNNLGAVQYM